MPTVTRAPNADSWGLNHITEMHIMSDEEYNTVATLRVMPESPDIDLNALKESITSVTPSNMKVHAIAEQPIAFGLVALDTFVLTNDKDGCDLDPVRDAYYALDGVSEVDVTDVGRILD